MMDFMEVTAKSPKKGLVQIYPRFLIKKSKDLMIRGSDFYAIWDEESGFWSDDEDTAIRLIDNEVKAYYEQHKSAWPDSIVQVLYLWDADSGLIDKWHRYCQKQLRDNYTPLNEKVIFANDGHKKEDFATHSLDYPLQEGATENYNELMNVLYSPEERHKIEWAIGSIVNGDSKHIQKFLVMYGSAGTGKGTVLKIIEHLFNGYFAVFDAKALGSLNSQFALEAFRTNPLVAIQEDGDLSKIEDNTRLNSLVSHELMTVNEKYKSTYSQSFNAFLFMGSNRPVKITDSRSGLLRRLIDVEPTGEKIPIRKYQALMKAIIFELSGIAYHCKEVYEADPDFYDGYIPKRMLSASNDFYNFILDSFDELSNPDGITLKASWEMYKVYCQDAAVSYPMTRRVFKEEMMNYFEEFLDEKRLPEGGHIRNVFQGFKFKIEDGKAKKAEKGYEINFGNFASIFDVEMKDAPAQYASQAETPISAWMNVTTTLKDVDTSKLHYVRVPTNHIVIDFDLKDKEGNKDYEANLREASKWPKTYAELSKSGQGVHLHYIYDGDPLLLEQIYKKDVEVKVFKGRASLRRKLTLCNDLPIAHISSGLPLKKKDERSTMLNDGVVKSEKSLRDLIGRNMRKEIHAATKPSMDFIKKILDDAYASDLSYDVRDIQNDLLYFAASSSHQSDYCIKLLDSMHFCSKDVEEGEKKAKAEARANEPVILFDCEVYPNLFVLCWMPDDDNDQVYSLINPTPQQVEEVAGKKLVGFNCRRYDNHILYGKMMGYNDDQTYLQSQTIINGGTDGFFGGAYNLSYTDIYDYCSKKQSLKKWEIELGIHHQECDIPWDQPVPDELIPKVVDYCCNDVRGTKAVWRKTQPDFIAREILADIAGMTVNDTTNSLTTRIIFGKDRHPVLNYRFLGDSIDGGFTYKEAEAAVDAIMAGNLTVEKFLSGVTMPYFPGYKYEGGKSTYRGEEVGEGGYVYAEPGMYGRAETKDVSGMHPHSILAENLFGDYTQNYRDIVEARTLIKHKDYEAARKLFGGKLAPYLTDESSAKQLSQALKIAVNSVYGLTAAHFDNPFHDNRNVDNIVAKRGALFMIDLKNAVQARGYKVIHIKTDSIKIMSPDDYILNWVSIFGKLYGYDFETEAVWDRICLVNDAVFIGHSPKEFVDPEEFEKTNGWSATGAQFKHPYIFKSLFSKKEIEFKDLCETKEVKKGALYLRDGEEDIFVGRVGSFCPMSEHGKELICINGDKTSAVTGTKGYLWRESEEVKNLKMEDCIDMSYFDHILDEARDSLVAYGPVEDFLDVNKNIDYLNENPCILPA